MTRQARRWLWIAALAIGAAPAPAPAQSPTAAAPTEVAPAPPGKLFSHEELDELVARIALYPDPLLALVLPAATNPLQVVMAQRFLEAKSGGEPPDDWDPAIVSLMNYPEVVKMMSDDLDWTQALGDAVAEQQADVMDAVQQARAQAQAAGNLETTAQQKVIVEKEVVKIVPADPEVIYVPRYDPQVIYVQSPAPVVAYYPPRPCYWCPAAAFGAGMVAGATTAMVGAAITAPFWAFDWHHHDIGWGYHGHNDFDFDIDRNIEINNNIKNVDKNVVNKGNGNEWKPDKNRSGHPRSGGGHASRPSRPEGGWNASQRSGGGGRPTTRPAHPGGERPGMGSGGGTHHTARPGSERPARDQKGIGSYDRGRDSVRYSQRGASSRSPSSTASFHPRSGSGSVQRPSGDGSRHGMGGYQWGGRSSAYSSRGASSRRHYGGGGGHRR